MAKFFRPIGPCVIERDGVEIGHSAGGIKIAYEQQTASSKLDKTGDTERSEVVTGESFLVTGAIGEASLANLAAQIPGSDLNSGGTMLDVISAVGMDLRENASEFVFKPLVQGVKSSNTAEYVYVPAGTIKPKWDVSYTHNGDKVFGFEIKGHPVTAEEIASGGRLAAKTYVEGQLFRMGA